jgi:hypothetical protein
MAVIVNDRDVLLQAAGTRFVTPALIGTVDWQTQVGGTGKPADYATFGATWGVNIGSQPTDLAGINASEGLKLGSIATGADVTSNILSSSGTSIVMSNANLFKSSSGVGGVFIGSGGIVGKNGSGVTTFSVHGTTGAAYFLGDISGGSNIEVTGTGKFDGITSDGTTSWAVLGNSSGNAVNGLQGSSGATGGAGVRGRAVHSGARGVRGEAVTPGSTGGYFTAGAATSTGLRCGNTDASGFGLVIESGLFSHNNTTVVSNLNADYVDGYNAGHSFGQVPISDGLPNNSLYADILDGYHAGNSNGQVAVSNGTVCTNLNADMLDGLHASSFTQTGHTHGVTDIYTSATSAKFQVSTDNVNWTNYYLRRIDW